MTGLLRNSDLVVMSSYAPLFARLERPQWAPDLIWFDNTRGLRNAVLPRCRRSTAATGPTSCCL